MRCNLLFLYTICLLLIFQSCSGNSLKFRVVNTTDFDRLDELVEIPLIDVENQLTIRKGEVINIIDAQDNILVSQITYDKKIIFQPKLKAGQTKDFKLVSAPKQNFDSRVYVNYHPERFGDIAWENDKVGFRLYGAPLEAIQVATSGLDLWYKRTSDLVLDEWYQKDISKVASYHVDHGEGCDPYAVGRSLGGGSMAPIVDDTLLLNNNFISHQIIENGPLRSTFKLVYPHITIDGQRFEDIKIVSLDAGSQLAKMSQEYNTNNQEISFKVAAGFVKREKDDKLVYDEGENYMIYQEPNSKTNGQIFLGLIFPQGIEKTAVNNYSYENPINLKTESYSNIIAQTTYITGKPMVYYTGFGWNKFGFENLDQFTKYIYNFNSALESPLLVTFQH